MKEVCVSCGKKEAHAKGLCPTCYKRGYIKTHPAYMERQGSRNNYVCDILTKHADEMKDDPEHLTTEFLQEIIGIKCKKGESGK